VTTVTKIEKTNRNSLQLSGVTKDRWKWWLFHELFGFHAVDR